MCCIDLERIASNTKSCPDWVDHFISVIGNRYYDFLSFWSLDEQPNNSRGDSDYDPIVIAMTIGS